MPPWALACPVLAQWKGHHGMLLTPALTDDITAQHEWLRNQPGGSMQGVGVTGLGRGWGDDPGRMAMAMGMEKQRQVSLCPVSNATDRTGRISRDTHLLSILFLNS